MIPLALLLDLKTASASYRAREKQAGKEERNSNDNDTDNVSMTVPMGAAFASALAAKDEVIEVQRGRIEDLQSALTHEREQSKSLLETVGRQQLLLSMTQDSPQEASGDTHTGAAGEDGEEVKEGEKQGLWSRIIGRLRSRA
jgi:predicted metalloprotease with PDZ domain